MLSTTQFSEVLKLPILIQHFIEHKHENSSITFLGFLEMHYAHGNIQDADYDKDMKLPFKTIVNSSIESTVFCSPIPVFTPNSVVYFTSNHQQYFYYSFTYSSAFLNSIWQPPRNNC
jgi:hypothetical protein